MLSSTHSLILRSAIPAAARLLPTLQLSRRFFTSPTVPARPSAPVTFPRLPRMPTLRSSFPTMRRGFQSSAPVLNTTDMFCYQCEQTRDATACTTVGVCGKTPETAAAQDLLVHTLKGVSEILTKTRQLGGAFDTQAASFVLEAMFSTLTNVNFDVDRIAAYINEAKVTRDRALAAFKVAGGKEGDLTSFATFELPATDTASLVALGKDFRVDSRIDAQGPDVTGLQEMIMYGLKGAMAYAKHAEILGNLDEPVLEGLVAELGSLTNPSPTVDSLLGSAMKVGELNLGVLANLDAGHTGRFGDPVPTQVSTKPQKGKAILVSGHDLVDLESLLEATQDTGINVYTHGEMLPAHSYPGLAKYPHLAGHYGGPWQLQKFEFSQFPGPIVMTSNCIVEPRKTYQGRIFTRAAVGWTGVTHLPERNWSQVISAAQAEEGFDEDAIEEIKERKLMTGFGHKTVLSVADKVIEGVKSGAISHFFVIGGCDGAESERSYFSELGAATPDDSIILTLGCGKYRVNNLGLGEVAGLPRVLDMGQCNDSYGAVQVAVALANAFDTDVNGLPLSFAISWFEQKAVAVLLTLLHLGVRDIRLGPNLPGFATPAMISVLHQKFNLSPISDVQTDLANMMKNQ